MGKKKKKEEEKENLIPLTHEDFSNSIMTSDVHYSTCGLDQVVILINVSEWQ